MRSGVLVALLASLAVGAAASHAVESSGAQASRAEAPSVRVDLQATRQVMQGFGTSVRVWSDPHLSKSPKTVVPARAQAEILTALYRRLGLTRARQVLDAGIAPGPGGPYDFSGKLGADQVAYVKQARAYGLKTVFPGPVYLEDWMKADDPAGYVTYAMAILRYWREKGFEPPLYAPINEPQISHDFPPEWMHDVVLLLGRRLRAEGFKTRLVIPDDENPGDAYRRSVAVLQDPQARQYVGALAYHIYRDYGEIGKMRQLASRYRLPLWMTEYQNDDYVEWDSSLPWAERVSDLITSGGVNAIDYIWGFFGSWVRSDTMISIDFDNGEYRRFSYTPLYWITGQWSRFVRPGYVRVAATPSGGEALVSAFKGAGRLVVVAVNPNGRTSDLRIAVEGGKLSGGVSAVRSSAQEHWAAVPPPRRLGASFSAALPARSVTTFVVKVGP